MLKMKSAEKFAIVFVTAPDLKTARRLVQTALRSRLIACANLISRIESHYWWQGKIQCSPEVMLILKTKKACVTALEKIIVAEHPYETPEFIVLPLNRGNQRYLDWLGNTCAA